MFFELKYPIRPQYLTPGTERRSGILMPGVSFLVDHDTGNPGSTAFGNVSYYERTNNADPTASAHDFVDDGDIVECIPFLTGTPEKAWHVLYNVTTDNQMFGHDANDYAGGFELCYGNGIDLYAAYDRYKWLNAFACYKYGLDPARRITGHHILDPRRKTDPMNAFKILGMTFQDNIDEIVKEYNSCVDVPNHKPLGDVLDDGIQNEIIDTWISPSWYQAKGDYQQYIHWLADSLRDPVEINPGVATTVIATWLSPAWYATSDTGKQNHLRDLANALRTAAGIPIS